MTSQLPIAKYRLEFNVQQPISLPEYAGSTLRGIFGHALRHLACVTRAKDCVGCMLAINCAYPLVFQPQKMESGSIKLATPPALYIIEPPECGSTHYETGDLLTFHFILLGNGCKHFPLMMLAWQHAFAQGVGMNDGTAKLNKVYHITPDTIIPIYELGGVIQPHSQRIQPVQTPPPERVSLRFNTPLRLQENGHALAPDRITARALLMALVRRTSLLVEQATGSPMFTVKEFLELAHAAGSILIIDQNLTWRDWTRHSNKQKKNMTLGGCIGSIQLQGDLQLFWLVLQLGQWLHVGKETVFGLGHYQLKP